MYLLDTCVLSEARRGSRPAVDWLGQVDEGALFLSVLTLGEISKGIEMRARTDRVAAESLRRWLHGLRTGYADRILPIDAEILLAWGALMARRPRPVADALIAATALIHRKTFVTRNQADFEDTGVDVVNPWAD
ncbi:MAG TPA: type II toxin-antitoxin system VapC family toxin [Acetobacteraceae bacterium]|nr:type II toxin-antitoxin system VapC family toxin [Acetobacteraceae bacterium]